MRDLQPHLSEEGNDISHGGNLHVKQSRLSLYCHRFWASREEGGVSGIAAGNQCDRVTSGFCRGHIHRRTYRQCTHENTQSHTHIYADVHICTHKHKRMRAQRAHMHKHTHTHTHANTCICAHTRTHFIFIAFMHEGGAMASAYLFGPCSTQSAISAVCLLRDVIIGRRRWARNRGGTAKHIVL